MAYQRSENHYHPVKDDIQLIPTDRLEYGRGHASPTYIPFSGRERQLVFIDPLASPKPTGEEQEMNNSGIGRLEFWLGISASIVGFIVIGCGATWSISNAISDKVNQSRIEINGSIQTSKTEITTRIDRLEDKVATGFKDNANGINELKLMINNQNDKKN